MLREQYLQKGNKIFKFKTMKDNTNRQFIFEIIQGKWESPQIKICNFPQEEWIDNDILLMRSKRRGNVYI